MPRDNESGHELNISSKFHSWHCFLGKKKKRKFKKVSSHKKKLSSSFLVNDKN